MERKSTIGRAGPRPANQYADKGKSLKNAWSRHWPLAVALGVLCAVVAGIFILCLRTNGGRFVYAVDDIYIILAVAKNFATHGVWGVTPYQFSSSTSTILWPLLLALIYTLGGTSELVPLFLNVTFAGATLLVVYIILREMGLPQRYQAAGLLGMVFLAPLPAVIFIGMEHTLQIGISILFVYVVARELAEDEGARSGASPGLWTLTVILPLVRYEELFLVFAACLLFLARRRWAEAFGLGVVAALPLTIYGAIAVDHGWYWLPNSVFLKANVPHAIGDLRALPLMGNWEGWTKTADLWVTALALLMLLALLVHQQGTFWRMSSIMMVLVLIAAGLHFRFARFGVFFRYEAYLIALSLLVLAVGAYEYLSGRQGRTSSKLETQLAGAWLGYSLFLPVLVLGSRGYNSLRHITQSCHNIYEQQYQMGLFLREFYLGVPLAANDIGSVSYLGEPHLVDLWGLGSLEVARAKVAGGLTPQQINQITKPQGTRIAIVYDSIFYNGFGGRGGLPAQWIRVGRWKLLDNYICTEDTVSFYAVDASEERALIAHLQQYAPRLPPEVVQSGKYTQSELR